MIVIGLDPSLTATGLAALDTREDGPFWEVGTIKSAPPKIPAEYSSLKRMQLIARQVELRIVELTGGENLDLAVIEAPAFSKNIGMSHERAGLWWKLFEVLTDQGCTVLVVKPNVRAKYATGKGNAGKDEVMLAVSRRYTDCEITNNNEADAVVLAAMGARYRGEPVESQLAQSHQAAMRTLTS